MNWDEVEAEVVEGQRLASGTAYRDPTFNQEIVLENVSGKGTLFRQALAFKSHGLDLDTYFGKDGYHLGTLNLQILPSEWRLGPKDQFEYYLKNVRWTDMLDKPNCEPFTESFYLSPCSVRFREKTYRAMIYIPDPQTKPVQHAPLGPYIDVIAAHIPDICYGSKISLNYNPLAIVVTRSD